MNKKIKVGETVNNKIKCMFCRNGNCKDIAHREVLNNFTDVYFCKKDNKVLKFTKSKEV